MKRQKEEDEETKAAREFIEGISIKQLLFYCRCSPE